MATDHMSNRNVIGEIVSGPLSDWWQNRAVKNGVPPLPERRLWLFYPALGFCFAGITVFLVTLDQATEGKWNVRPDIGLALAGLGNQMSTTILFTCMSSTQNNKTDQYA